MVITNTSDISLSLAVWLLHDEYDYVNEPNYISVTGLMKPLRHILLPSRIAKENKVPVDVQDYISRALGNSLHDSIEKAWHKGYRRSLKMLGYPDEAIERIKVNPDADTLASTENCIPIYLEQRAIKSFQGYRIGGKFDMVADGIVHDNKSTSSFTWVHGTRDEEHQLQGSLYRWLNPDKITHDFIRINYIFTDWQKASAKSNPKYPQKRVEYKDIPLLSLADTEAWISKKLALIEKYQNSPEKEIPECTQEELWQSEPVYKYYSDPTKTDGRSTKNFDAHSDARMFQAEKGGKGIVITVPGQPKRCGYCDSFSICTQKDKYQL